MRLYVDTMDLVVVECAADGRVLLETGQGEKEWIEPSLQETRAILHAAQQEIASLTELVDVLGRR